MPKSVGVSRRAVTIKVIMPNTCLNRLEASSVVAPTASADVRDVERLCRLEFVGSFKFLYFPNSLQTMVYSNYVSKSMLH